MRVSLFGAPPVYSPHPHHYSPSSSLSLLSKTGREILKEEATFNQTNYWFILFSFHWHKILVLIFNKFIYAKVVHSEFVQMCEDASYDIFIDRQRLQSMTSGIGTYKPFGPVHMRTLLARIHIHWPESKLTISDINWKKVMKRIKYGRKDMN
jgi:hypothetical protein